jgi:hypothetical protein
MSDVIGFLEKWGQNARLRHATRTELAQEIQNAGIDPFVQKVLLEADQRRLEFLVGAQPNVCCMVAVPKGDEDLEEQPKKAAEEDKEQAA